ncbi:MAG: glucose 1-dehydrogenase [Caldilineales bacterium]|nr:glucose 1-dehydrogenase [Caldilineales bacterium]
MDQRFAGKTAIVTGAGRGIGRGVALRLAREGANVVIAEYNAESAEAVAAEIESLGVESMPYAIDISDAGRARRMVEDVAGRFGRIDILVNNAGVVQTKPMMDLTEADWDRIVNVNQRGTFFCLQAVAEQMLRQLPDSLKAAAGLADVVAVQLSADKESSKVEPTELEPSYGKIVNFSSIAGRRGRPLSTHYAATKAAIISITQSAALALAPYRINVNAVCPGIVVTPMWHEIDRDRAALFGAKEGEAVKAFVNTVPLKRAATEDEIAGVVAFLCSSDANYITGQAINVDGGFEMN